MRMTSLLCLFLAVLPGLWSWGDPVCEVLAPSAAFLASVTNQVEAIPLACQAGIVKETRLDRVDLLVAYDVSAQNWLVEEGKGTPEEYAAACVAKMNKALSDSAIGEFSFRLVGTVLVNEDVSRLTMVDILSERLVDEDGNFVGQGSWRGVYSARERLGADIVSVLVGKGKSGVVGLSYALDSAYRRNVSNIHRFGNLAYSLCSIRSADTCMMQLHEVAHTMGCGHADAGCVARGAGIQFGPQLFTYSSGYYFWAGDKGYHTIMGYNFGGFRPDGSYVESDRFEEVPVFSSPLLSYGGVAVGTEINDNRRTLLESYQQVAQYRTSVSSSGDDPKVDTPLTFEKAVTLNGVCRNAGGDVAGIVQLKIGATSKKTLTSKVSGTLTGLDGKKRTLTFPERMLCTVSEPTVEGTVRGVGPITLRVSANGFTGEVGNGDTVIRTAETVIGGALKSETPRFRYGDVPAQIGGLAVLMNLVPTAGEPVLEVGSRWKLAGASTVRFKRGVLDEAALVKSQDRGYTNLAGLKLTYTSKTGIFKGSFKLYGTGSAVNPKKMTITVSGVVVDGVGYGLAQVKSPALKWSVSVR